MTAWSMVFCCDNIVAVRGGAEEGLEVRNRLIMEAIMSYLTGCAWLHRHGKATWTFKWNEEHLEMTHITRYGNVYAILVGLPYGKPFWIGMLNDGSWCTVENHLRSREIEFENGGRYKFPG